MIFFSIKVYNVHLEIVNSYFYIDFRSKNHFNTDKNASDVNREKRETGIPQLYWFLTLFSFHLEFSLLIKYSFENEANL